MAVSSGASSADRGVRALMAALPAALVAGSRDAFTALLTEDVCWGGEHGGNECTSRGQAGDHYAGLLAAGVTLGISALEEIDAPGVDASGVGGVLVARIQVSTPDPGDFPSELTVRLTLRGGLIADIRELDPPATIELLYFEGCPHYETFLPHLRELLAEHAISTPITLVRIKDEDEARAHRFLGSPSLRVNGHDVDPGSPGRDREDDYALVCRLYSTPDGLTGTPADQWILAALLPDPVHEAAVAAIHCGDLAALQQLLTDHRGLAGARLSHRHQGRTLLHVATDWPGHYPHVAASIAALVAAGADPNAPSLGEHPETPLHWAASSGDLAALDALLEAGADINARGAVIAGGTAMADATAFGQWEAARRLLEHGADTNLFEAAALGLVSRVQAHLAASQPTSEDITSSFWGACHGGHVTTAAVLLEHGVDLNWIGYDGLTPLDAARRAEAGPLTAWLEDRGATTAPGQPPES